MPQPSTPTAAVTIRRAGPADARTLAALGRATFVETWLEDHRMPYAADAVERHLDANFGEPVVAARLADAACAYWIAERDGEATGFALAGPCSLPYADVTPDDGELKQLYLRRADRSGGTGGRLFAEALTWLERDGPRRIWIGVWSGNHAARRFYAREGFAKVGEHSYPVGEVVDDEIAMRRG